MDINQSCIRIFANPIQIQACKQKITETENSFNALAQVLNLAGNEVRLKILFLLDQENELCPCDISDILMMSVPAVSQHLRKLKDANLIGYRKKGQLIFYTLKTEHLNILTPLFSHLQTKEFAE